VASGEAELRERLRGCAATRALAEGVLEEQHGGLSNRAWRLDAAGGPWFVRLGAADAAGLGVDRASECALLAAVSAAGLAPEVLACEPDAGLLVTRWVAGGPWRAGDPLEGDNLARIAALLRRLHDQPVPDGVAFVSWSRQARRLAAELPMRSGEALLHARAAQAFERLDRRSVAPVLCHHDLHHLNILDDGARLWLVDWEYGGGGDPLFDLAGFLAMHGLGPAATDGFLRAYGGLGPSGRALLDTARWAFDYVQWLWYRHRAPDATGEAGARARRLAQRLLHCDNSMIDQDHG
jgi:thiamine kinase-like enzyme